MNSGESGFDAMVSGTIHSIFVSRRGVELNIVWDHDPPPSDEKPYYTCRLDRSASHLASMLDLAKTAMLHNLTVTVLGSGDDRDDTLEFNEVRIEGKQSKS